MELEITRRVDEQVQQRLASEREKLEKEIELEVQRRLTEAKRILEKQIQEEFEKQKQLEFKLFLEKEVHLIFNTPFFLNAHFNYIII